MLRLLPDPPQREPDTCVTCHDQADVTLEIHDDTFDSGRLVADTCIPHIRESWEYLLTVDAPRRGWRFGVTQPSP